jgi:hypothetical protein
MIMHTFTNLVVGRFRAFLDKRMSGGYIIPRIVLTPDAKGKTSESERKMNMKKYQITEGSL